MIPVLTFFAVTSTPGINAPEASATVPLRTALTWANAEFKAATYSKTIDKVASFFTALSSSHRRPPIDFSAGIYHLLARATMRPVSTVAALPKAAKRREKTARLVRGLAGLDSSAQERLNPDFGRECPMYGTLVGDIQQARPLLF